MPSFTEILSVEAALIHANRQMDRKMD